MRRLLGATALFGAVGFVLLVGCGEEADPIAPPAANGGDAGPTPTSEGGTSQPLPVTPGAATDYCGETAGKFIDAYLGCCNAEDQQRTQYKLLAGLYAKLEADCPLRLDASLSQGRLAHNATAAAQCYPAYQSFIAQGICGDLSGRDIPQDLASCKDVFRGLVAEGGACRGDHECLDGLTCVGSTTQFDGICKSPPAIGEACGDGVVDGGGADLAIRFGFGTHPKCASGGFCSSRKCRAQIALGQTCFSGDECQTGLRCFQMKCSAEGPSDLGGPCRNANDCKTGQYCNAAAIGQQGTCAARKSDGTPCTNVASECKGLCDKPDGGSSGTCGSYCGSG